MAVSRAAASRIAITSISIGIRYEIAIPPPYRGVAQDPAQGGGNGDLRGRLRGKRGRRWVQKDFVDRRQLAKQPNESDKFRSRCRPHRSIEELRLKLAGPQRNCAF